MKYSSIYFLIVLALSAGCSKKTDNVFDKTVDERLTETLTNYQNYLTGAPGWKLFVYPKGLESEGIRLGGLTYYLKFAANNRVAMVSDFQTAVATSPKESGFHLKALQRPSLIFDTYSYMHLPADPDPDVSLSPTGAGGYGRGSDFSFAFTDVTPKDTINLEGNFNNSPAVLIKATQSEMDAAFVRSRLRDVMNMTYNYPNVYPYLYFQASAALRVSVGFDFDNVIISFPYTVGNSLINTSVPFSFTTYGIHLMTAVTLGNYTFQDIYWDDAKRIYYILSGTTHVEFGSTASPLITLSLANTIGTQYTTISVPAGAGLPNTSPFFLANYNTSADALLAGPYGLTLDDMNFVFNAGSKTLTLNVLLYQGDDGPYIAQYFYSYAVDASGYFKFTRVGQNGNAGLIVNEMNPLLRYFDTDQFRLEGVSTSYSFLGQFTSRQTPTYFFRGYLY